MNSQPAMPASFRLLLVAALGFVLDGRLAQAQEVAGLQLEPAAAADSADAADTSDSPLRVTLAQEAAYKAEQPDRLIKNRTSVRLEYSQYFLDHFVVQFSGKTTAFLKKDHRHDAERTDTTVSQAYVQTSAGQTSVRAGIQALAWGESLLAPITDVVSPRDNRELFNFNLEELRIGQPMLAVDQYSSFGRWSMFWIPKPAFNKNPKPGTAYSFDPFRYRARIEGDDGGEYGASWKKNSENADVTLMAASLVDNDYGLAMNADGTVTRVKERYALAGLSFTYALKSFVLRGEAALKSSKAFNDAALRIVKKRAFDSYLGLDYRYSATLTVGVELVDQHIAGWTDAIQGYARDNRSLLLNVSKTMMNDDLTVNLLHFQNRPYRASVTVLESTYKWNDHVTLGFNASVPDTNDRRSALWNVRDQKQVGFRIQYQF
ncbi:DUF1302 family protein [Massilia sp. Root335]|uniref:DUF1302 family protein n=1 Tax=Massilia sp. Root335 TaxID=1736517 RepID=UPI0012F6ACCA|nr:DUF1302 family protein [Massilia sp. Root335]